ncbi:Scr1 family TA system antitoxin-like transcriptional regulator [Streptomyces sp. NPDC051214]|uniref:Scr1 family TA system antitoxin-like transcriptional regulator n=1 Tax=Streptomyces sp. NPDC051214 TaxID=3155282 RepID=UPI00342D545C
MSLLGVPAMLHYCANVIWGNLQTPAYARSMLRVVAEAHNTGHDTIEDAVAARTARAALIGKEGRTSHQLLSEQALRTNIGGPTVMRGQLDHLADAISLDGLTLGVIPARALMPCPPPATFTVFDQQLVDIETASTLIQIAAPAEVAAHVHTFELMQTIALYEHQTHDLIIAERNKLPSP